MDVAVRTSTDLFWMRYRNGARGGVREVFFRSQHCYTLSRHARPLVSGRRTSPSPPHIASDTDTRPSLSTYIKFAVYCHTGGGEREGHVACQNGVPLFSDLRRKIFFLAVSRISIDSYFLWLGLFRAWRHLSSPCFIKNYYIKFKKLLKIRGSSRK